MDEFSTIKCYETSPSHASLTDDISSDGNICDSIFLSYTLFVEEEQQSNMHTSIINPTSIDCCDVLSNIDGSTDELLSNMIIIHDTSPAVHSA